MQLQYDESSGSENSIFVHIYVITITTSHPEQNIVQQNTDRENDADYRKREFNLEEKAVVVVRLGHFVCHTTEYEECLQNEDKNPGTISEVCSDE